MSHGVEPAYDPASFQHTRATYHKYPTTSKIPPSEDEIRGFIAIVNQCISQSRAQGYPDAEICVHCHYGFNRTGFVICCWLVEMAGYSVHDALEAFKLARPNGIR